VVRDGMVEAQPQPKTDQELRDQLYDTMHNGVELVRDLKGRITDDDYLDLRAGVMGLMNVYAAVTGLPSPAEYTQGTRNGTSN
jgi:hypothetical protein